MSRRTRRTRAAINASPPVGLQLLSNPWLPAAILTVALFILVVWVRRIGDFGVETDFYGTYAPGARDIGQGHVDSRRYGVTGPLYEFVLAFGMLLRIPVFPFAKTLSALSIIGALILWTKIATRIFGDRVGRWVPWLLILSPTFVRFGYTASSDALYCFLFSWAVFALTQAENAKASFKSGLVALLAFLTRYQALVFPGFAFLWWIGKPKALRLWGLFLIAFPGVLLIGLLALSLAGVSVPKPDFLYNVHYEVSKGHVDWDDYLNQAGDRGNPWDVLIKQPGSVLIAALSNLPRHLENEMMHAAGWALIPFMIAGFAGLFVSAPGRGSALRFACFWLLQFLLLLPTQVSERYALTQIPLLAVVSAWSLETLAARLRRERVARAVPVLCVAILCGLALNVRNQIAYQKRQPRFLIETAVHVQSLIHSTDRIMTRKPHLPYLLNCQWVYFPDAQDLTALRANLTKTPAEYLYYGRSEFTLRPNFRFLFFPPYRPAGWDVVRSDPNGVLYRVGQTFFSSDIPADDVELRKLENDTLAGNEVPVEEARRLAAFLVATERCEQAVSEYERIQKFAPLSNEDEHNLERCREALRAKQNR